MFTSASPPANRAQAFQNQFLRRHRCPFCGQLTSRSPRKVASIPPAETISAEEHGRFLSGYTSHRVFFTYVECEECSALFCPIFYNQDQLNRLYAHQPENMAEASLEGRKRTQHGYARMLMGYAPAHGNFLEIGADIGLFAGVCAQSGLFNKMFLYEPNLLVHAELAQRLAGRDITINHESFSPADVPAASVSAAAMIHVLDHILDPVALVREIRDVMQPGGLLLVVVHNSQSLLARILGRRFPPFTLQHPHLFSPKSLTRLLASAGLECVGIKNTTNYFPVTHFARAALSILGLKPDILPAWDRPLIGLQLGNIAAIARKPS
jgi:SAM-dependent methyltransferase